MIALIAFLLVSIVFSFLCSVWEAVLLSVTPSFTQMKLQEGGELGKNLKSFKDNIDRPLAAILTLNTIAHTVGAIGVGAQATKIWGASFMGTVVVPVAMTLAILILSEIIPKTIGANYWRELAGFTVNSLKLVIFLLAPLVFISQLITKALKKDKGASVLSRADFGAMTELGSEQGLFDEAETNILRNLLRFKTIVAENVMTPRTVMIAADEDLTIGEFHKAHPELRFSRIPLFKTSPDHINGYLLKDRVLQEIIKGNDKAPLSTLRRDTLAVKGSLPIPELFNHFMEKREHMAIVLDEFGGTAGIVTMEDVIETLLGLEIVDERDNVEDMQRLARQQWEARARNLGLIQVGDSSENADSSAEKSGDSDAGE